MSRCLARPEIGDVLRCSRCNAEFGYVGYWKICPKCVAKTHVAVQSRVYVPTLADIAEQTAAIQAKWSEQEEQSRRYANPPATFPLWKRGVRCGRTGRSSLLCSESSPAG